MTLLAHKFIHSVIHSFFSFTCASRTLLLLKTLLLNTGWAMVSLEAFVNVWHLGQLAPFFENRLLSLATTCWYLNHSRPPFTTPTSECCLQSTHAHKPNAKAMSGPKNAVDTKGRCEHYSLHIFNLTFLKEIQVIYKKRRGNLTVTNLELEHPCPFLHKGMEEINY